MNEQKMILSLYEIPFNADDLGLSLEKAKSMSNEDLTSLVKGHIVNVPTISGVNEFIKEQINKKEFKGVILNVEIYKVTAVINYPEDEEIVVKISYDKLKHDRFINGVNIDVAPLYI